MNRVKVAKAGTKVGVYTAIGAGVEAAVTVMFPQVVSVPGLGNGGITVGVAIAIGALVNWFKHRKS